MVSVGEQDVDSITKQSKTRKLTADFLEQFLENRFDVEELAERGLLTQPIHENEDEALHRLQHSEPKEVFDSMTALLLSLCDETTEHAMF